MNKMIDSKRYFLYSSLSFEMKKIYYRMIYRFLGKLGLEYPKFYEWYQGLFTSTYDMKPDRDIIICESVLSLAGVAIIKNSQAERKICTLRVAKDFKRQGIGHQLIEISFRQLETEKPVMTLHKNKFNQFEKILEYYHFELEQTQKHYYNIFNTELVFNGTLPEKERRFRISDFSQFYEKNIASATVYVRSYMEYLETSFRKIALLGYQPEENKRIRASRTNEGVLS